MPSAVVPAPDSPSSSQRTTGTVAQERTRDERGIPVIPGLEDAGVIVFDDLWKCAQAEPMDEAVSRLEGVLDLIQHHPALAPEADALRRLCRAWWELVPGENTRRLAAFELHLDHARGLPMPKAVSMLLTMWVGFVRDADLAEERARLNTIWEAWTMLNDNQVSERSRKL